MNYASQTSTHRATMSHATPMLRFLRALTKPQQEAFAAAVGTTRVYLYQLAAQPNPNPRLQLALAIRNESRVWAKRVMTEPLALEDLLVGVPPDDKE